MTVALVLGGAACVWEDVEAALSLGEFDAVVACNDIAADWPGPVDAAASLHPECWPIWTARRASKGLPPIVRLFDGAWRFPGQTASGSSGLFALKAALIDLGHDKAVLCGVPMNGARHIASLKAWNAADNLRPGWLEAFPTIQRRARSMSGWTADLLGRPDASWLAS